MSRLHISTLLWVLTFWTFLPSLPAYAQQWSEFAYISGTLGVSDSRICIGEASRGELGCPSFAPTISPTGHTTFTSGLTTNAISLTTTGTTWGYLGSAASYIPNLTTNNISTTTINGVSVSALGGGASLTNVPAFRAVKSANQTMTASTWTKITFDTEEFDNLNSYTPATSRFQPSVMGNYLITANTDCGAGAIKCYLIVYKNGISIPVESGTRNASSLPTIATIIQLNGTSDYVEIFAFSDTTTLTTTSSFSGSLLASGNGLVSGTGATALSALTDVTLSSPATGQVLTYNGTSWVNSTPAYTSATLISGTTMFTNWPDAIVCQGPSSQKYIFYITAQNANGSVSYRYVPNPTATSDLSFGFNADGSSNGSLSNSYDCYNKSIAQLYAEGKAFNFIGGSGTGALGDRLTSGTLTVTANSTTSVISLTTSGTTWGYMSANGSYLPNIATNAIQVISATTPLTCDATKAGTLRYNSPTTALELCTGSGWQVMGVGIPAGTISAFASTTCPTGWSEYTPARGRFLRGIDNGAGNDPNGTRAPGSAQDDAFQEHTHSFNNGGTADGVPLNASSNATYSIPWRSGAGTLSATWFTGALQFGSYGVPRLASETRPKNAAVTFCQFNGTSNGWNNPLSGGSTTAAGSTGQIQYNTGNSFDANAGLTWDNANQRLNAANVNVTGKVSATVVQLTNNPANPCDGTALGTLKTINGKIYICRQ